MSAVLRVEAFLVMALLVAPDQPASGADAFSASGESRGTLDPVPGCKKGYLCCSLEGQPTVCVNKESLNSGLYLESFVLKVRAARPRQGAGPQHVEEREVSHAREGMLAPQVEALF
eukprot:CAMPEP_0198505312 /NCGR_PEP_ID=MMETSP1462-20131121/10940_1 /TAXON_ID=1333877 /ORGANISM="Brandtodinium nutriculum, Strain RCC3387" /LENGTH=115 /DNA_ID=CAMNT_0044234485 /DNA_START=76 /DNA_END=422 /DNA_ORIENTATION=-